jgi:sugar/nucleoside kinase (ribokinase family)
VSRVAVVGSTVRDVILEPGRPPAVRPGGAPLFAARALAASGDVVSVATRCADAGLATELASLARPLCLRLDGESVSSELRYRHDGERDHALLGLGADWSADDVEGFAAPALREAAWVQVGTQRAGDLGADVLRALAAGGRRLALDAQGPMRAARLGSLSLTGALPAELLRNVRVLKLSEEEAMAGYGTADAGAVAQATGVAEVVVTLGRTGVSVAAGGETREIRGDPVPVAEATGAGDSFLALYVGARAREVAPAEAAEQAARGVADILRSRGSPGR